MVPCESLSSPANPLRGSGVSDRSPANSLGIGVVPCESLSSPMNPLRGSGVSERSRCGAVLARRRIFAGIGRVGLLAGEPSAGIGVVPCESLSSPMNPLRGSGVSECCGCGAVQMRTFCGDRACRIARRRTLCGARCGAVRILELAGEPRVGSLSLWCRANP